MIIFYGESKDKEDFKNRALKECKRLTGVDVGEIYYLESGKPCVEYGFISISHTKDMVVVAFSSENIGIDIEKEDRDIKLKMSILEWTEYEAYCKWQGTGILKSTIYDSFDKTPIKHIDKIDGYIVSVYSKDNDISLVKI